MPRLTPVTDGSAEDRLERFARLVSTDPTLVPLDQAALALAGVLRGRTAEAPALAALNELAAGVPERTFEGLRRHLYDDIGFTGDGRRFDDPVNSYLDLVLRRRRGLPILLATVMIEVGRRAGVAVVGIGMPMHFLVGDALDPEALLDPFTGIGLDPEGARAQFDQLAGGRLTWDDRHLDPVPSGVIVARMLANLHGSFTRRQDTARVAMVAMMRWRMAGLAMGPDAALARRVLAPFN